MNTINTAKRRRGWIQKVNKRVEKGEAIPLKNMMRGVRVLFNVELLLDFASAPLNSR